MENVVAIELGGLGIHKREGKRENQSPGLGNGGRRSVVTSKTTTDIASQGYSEVYLNNVCKALSGLWMQCKL